MGGKSSQTQSSNSITAPWAPAQPALKGILDQLNPLIQNAGLSGTAQGAFNELTANAQQGNPFAGQIQDFTKSLLEGGGANAQAPYVQGGFDAFNARLSPYADGSNIGNNPALRAQLDTLLSDVSNSVNGQFAAAGRDLSGMNQQTLARGYTQGAAPILAAQYNTDVDRALGAANSLYNAQNSTSGILSGMNQQGLTNQLQGVTTANDALAAQNYTPTQLLNIEQLKKSMPAETLGLLAQIGIPIAGLGGETKGTSTGTQKMSGAQQFATIASGLGNVGKFMWG